MFVPEPVTPEKLEAIALTSYIDELGRQLNSARDGKYDSDEFISRSPSPPPEYDKQGKRTNTREHRIQNALNVERTLAVRKALELIPDYVPPSDFDRLTRIVEKYPIPVRDFPQINFVGLLLGPRGNALRRMETDSGARISIRGRGSVKEGSRSASVQGQEEDLHCLVSAASHESIRKAFSFIKQVVDTATQTPEHQNDFKRLQLRELAELNGTLRDYENQLCTFCGEPGHRKFSCPQREAALKDAVCRACGQQGHIMRDCDSPEAKRVSSPGAQPSGLEEFLNDLEDDIISQDSAKEVGESTETKPSTSAATDVLQQRLAQPGSDTQSHNSNNSPGAFSSSNSLSQDFAAAGNGTTTISPPGVPPLHPSFSNTVSSHSPPPSANVLPAPPGLASSDSKSLSGVLPANNVPNGLTPPGVPPGVPTLDMRPPGVSQPNMRPPVISPPGITAPGNAPVPIAPGVTSTRKQPAQGAPPPAAWKPPTWKPPATSP